MSYSGHKHLFFLLSEPPFILLCYPIKWRRACCLYLTTFTFPVRSFQLMCANVELWLWGLCYHRTWAYSVTRLSQTTKVPAESALTSRQCIQSPTLVRFSAALTDLNPHNPVDSGKNWRADHSKVVCNHNKGLVFIDNTTCETWEAKSVLYTIWRQ